jgi:hypothetical protein
VPAESAAGDAADRFASRLAAGPRELAGPLSGRIVAGGLPAITDQLHDLQFDTFEIVN